jgi:signal transduction histidine kinase
MLAPLIAQGQPLGLLILARSEPFSTPQRPSFVLKDIPHVQDFAEQAAVAFANARSYQHLQAAHQGLQELDQLKDQFIMTASHELRTPLTTIQGYLELMEHFGDLLSSDQRQAFLDKAQRSCNELVVLLANVMDASRLTVDPGVEAAHLERVRVYETIERVMEFIGPQVSREQREVQLDIPAELAMHADPARLRQVLLNISTNALKYSPPRTPLKFAARKSGHQRVMLSVSDRGKGIALQDQARLFQRFVRLERDINSSVRGSGLGLYIARSLIEVMGGNIWVESSGIPGEGSTFYIELPSAQ